VELRIQLGQVSLSQSIFVWIVVRYTGTWVFISVLCGKSSHLITSHSIMLLECYCSLLVLYLRSRFLRRSSLSPSTASNPSAFSTLSISFTTLSCHCSRFIGTHSNFRLYSLSRRSINSSTNLDTWSLAQLRNIKVGGNASLTDFLTKHGAQSLLPPGNHDARARYTSRQAGLYKEELARKVEADIQR
jgi:hypothetical protein